jgi:hypothetical protein
MFPPPGTSTKTGAQTSMPADQPADSASPSTP